MGKKFVKDADTGEIYILPDETQALKNTPPHLKEELTKSKGDISECYARNNSIAILQKELQKRDRQLKLLSVKKELLSKKWFIVCIAILAVIAAFAVIVAIVSCSKLAELSPSSENISVNVGNTVPSVLESEHSPSVFGFLKYFFGEHTGEAVSFCGFLLFLIVICIICRGPYEYSRYKE